MSVRGDRCPDDLLARSRRGPLSLVERRALEAHLAVCGPCRATAALAALYEQIPDSPSSDDRAVVARLAGRVTLPGRRRPGSPRRVAFAAGAALMAVAGVAAAWAVLQRASAPSSTRAVSRAAVGAPGVASGTAPRSLDQAAVVVPPPSKPAAGPRHVRVAGADARVRVTGNREVPSEPTDDPGALFAAANAARGAGDLRAAALRYDQLERRYPASPEAAVSQVSAGDLLARLGESAAALEHFDRYLGTDARGPLASEALFGRARCLRELGRRRDELETWRDLLRRFPGSAYETTARARVDELSR
jgi:TolA-binding protein